MTHVVVVSVSSDILTSRLLRWLSDHPVSAAPTDGARPHKVQNQAHKDANIMLKCKDTSFKTDTAAS